MNHYTRNDFLEVIHIIDMDGAYIPDDHILLDESAQEPIYSLNDIKTANPDKIIKRNKIKRDNIDVLSCLNHVWVDITYHAYYMSSNLDHALYGKINCADEEKKNNSYEFAKKYKDHLDDFLTFISDSDFSKSDDYKQSWEFIKEGTHSLERYTNLGICFAEIRKNRQSENKNPE